MNAPVARAMLKYLTVILLLLAGTASSQPLNIGVMEAAPLAYLEDTTYEPKGVLVDYARKLFDQMSVEYRLIIVPLKRLSYMAEKGQIDIAITLDDGRIHHYMNRIKLLESVEILAFSQQENNPLQLELVSQPLDVLHGYRASNDQHLSNIPIEINNAEQLFALLDAKRIDGGFGLKPMLEYGANTRRHTEQIHTARSMGFADIVIWSSPKSGPGIPRQLSPLAMPLSF